MALDDKALKVLKKKQAALIKRMSAVIIGVYDTYGIHISKAKNLVMLNALSSINMFKTPYGTEAMSQYDKLVQQAFMVGTKSQGGTKTALTNTYSQVLSDNANKFIYDMGERVSTNLLEVISKGNANPEMTFNDIMRDVRTQLNNETYQATRIVRTETMRASNSAAYIQAKSEGKQYWIADNRDEACEICADLYEGQVFTMDNTADLPPVHPNCACVPEFFDIESEAQGWADDIQQENENLRNGEQPTTDGQGAWTGKQYGEGEVTVTVEK
jgi:SPP1 gp7 family putative phage head morphogenesis protein